nr:hypothetical protein [Haladaptatus sp. W1]
MARRTGERPDQRRHPTARIYDPAFTIAKENGYHSAFIFTDSTGHEYYTYLVLACTGIGSMSIFGGLIAAVRAPLRRKLRGFTLAIVIIWC